MADEPQPPTRNESSAGAGGKKPPADDTLSMHRLAGVGMEFVGAFGLFAGLGWLADRWLGTKPWLLIVGGALGFAAGLRNLIRAGRNAMK